MGILVLVGLCLIAVGPMWASDIDLPTGMDGVTELNKLRSPIPPGATGTSAIEAKQGGDLKYKKFSEHIGLNQRLANCEDVWHVCGAGVEVCQQLFCNVKGTRKIKGGVGQAIMVRCMDHHPKGIELQKSFENGVYKIYCQLQ